MRKLFIFIIITGMLALGSNAIADMTQQEKQEMIVDELIETCLEKMEVENIPMTKSNLKECGAKQIPATIFNTSFIIKVGNLPESKSKEILKAVAVSCVNENKLPSGKMDQYETAKCIKLKVDVLDYMIKQKLKEY